ncbi:MAG: hypothetical protein ACI4RA_05590 [Kiritimatiellia bacterium]
MWLAEPGEAGGPLRFALALGEVAAQGFDEGGVALVDDGLAGFRCGEAAEDLLGGLAGGFEARDVDGDGDGHGWRGGWWRG